MTYIKNKSNKDCNEALLRIFKNIDIEKIKDFINSTKTIKEVRKDFYIKIISIRYEILKETYDDLKTTN